jgi:hypothetical protein
MPWQLKNPTDKGYSLINKVRSLASLPAEFQMPDVEITAKINQFYTQTLPLELRPEILCGYWRWNTIGAYEVARGDGVQTSWAGTLSSKPQAGGVGFTDGNETFEDDGLGVLWGSLGGSGTIDYVTGAYTLLFAAPTPKNGPIGAYFDGMNIPDSILKIELPVMFSSYFAQLTFDPKLFWARWPTYQPFANNPPGSWAANTPYNTGAVIQPTMLNGYFYRVVTGGISGTVEPTWGTLVNQTTNDNGMVWMAIFSEEQPPIAVPYLPNTPCEVLMFGNRITMRPAPDMVYLAKMPCINKPPLLVNPTDAPLREEWGKLIAIGAALDIAEDAEDDEKITYLTGLYDRERGLAGRPDILQMSGRRARGSF